MMLSFVKIEESHWNIEGFLGRQNDAEAIRVFKRKADIERTLGSHDPVSEVICFLMLVAHIEMSESCIPDFKMAFMHDTRSSIHDSR